MDNGDIGDAAQECAVEVKNPYRPGAGHMPPYLAGRAAEEREFRRLLRQDTILENLILTGLRGVGKTVLLERFKRVAIQEGWLWVGTDLSETTSVSETNLPVRLITDLSVVTSGLTLSLGQSSTPGFTSGNEEILQPVNYSYLSSIYEDTPGLIVDKLKRVLEFVWSLVCQTNKNGVIFAYDEAQNISNNSRKEQYPLSVLLDAFQSLPRRNIPFMLALVGSPTLVARLGDARAFSERMFRVLSLGQLSEPDSRDAIVKPVEDADCPFAFTPRSVAAIAELSGGYPYFIQFICREVFDLWIQQLYDDRVPAIPTDEIIRKLDSDFFAGRWARATDRQRELLHVIAQLDNARGAFSVHDIEAQSSKTLDKGFSNSQASQMLLSLANAGFVFKNGNGRYSLAVPLMDGFIRRQYPG